VLRIQVSDLFVGQGLVRLGWVVYVGECQKAEIGRTNDDAAMEVCISGVAKLFP
jgi:hypothetical protein